MHKRLAQTSLMLIAGILSGCVSIPINSVNPEWVRIYDVHGIQREAVDVIDESDVYQLINLFDNELDWRTAGDGDQLFSAQGRAIYTMFVMGEYGHSVVIYITEDAVYRGFEVADADSTFFEKFDGIHNTYQFESDPTATYEVFLNGNYYDPLAPETLQNTYNTDNRIPDGPERRLRIVRTNLEYPEIREPVLITHDPSLITNSVKARGVKIRYVVLDSGEVINAEVLNTVDSSLTDSAYDYMDSLIYKGGIFEGEFVSYRITKTL